MLVGDELIDRLLVVGLPFDQRLRGDQMTLDVYLPYELEPMQAELVAELVEDFPPYLTLHRRSLRELRASATLEDLAETMRARGFEASVVQDSLMISFDHPGAEVPSTDYLIAQPLHPLSPWLGFEPHPYQVEMMERLEDPRQLTPTNSAKFGLRFGASRADLERMIALRPSITICDEIETALCAPDEPNNQPHYRKLEKKGKRW